MGVPQTRYARSGDVRIAYQVVGNGPVDLVFVPGYISNLDLQWEDPGFVHLMTRLGAFTRLIMLDKRGTGLSDRVDIQHLPSLETRMDDVRAVMDATGTRRAVLLGASEGGPMAILFAATYPTRTRALVLYGAYAHFHTWVLSREGLEEFIRGIETAWGTGKTVVRFAPEQGQDERFRAWWGRHERFGASPTAAVALARMNAAIDVRSILPVIRVPTLVIHRTNDARVKLSGGRYLADKIPGARFSEIPGRDHPIWTGNVDRVVDEIEEFLTGMRPMPAATRILATLMIARLARAQQAAVRLGDRVWSERLQALRSAADGLIARHGGMLLASGAEELGARFDGPARAVRCALALVETADGLAIPLACGVHTGEVELGHDALSVSGFALHVAMRMAEHAVAGEVLASGVVTDLVAGSGLHFAERGHNGIEGVGDLRLFAVVKEQHLESLRRAPAMSSLGALSSREREVLSLVAEGMSNAAIAARLKLSRHTVKRHVANILLKLDLPTRAAAAALVGRSPRGL